jgi:hypothetical protein
MDFTPVEFSTLTFAGLLEDIYLSRAVGAFPAGYFIFDAGVPDRVAVPDEQLPDSFGSKSLLSGAFEVRLKILADLLADGFSEDTRGPGDLPVLGKDLIGCPFLYFLDPANVLLRSVLGYAQFTGCSLDGTMEFVQIHDSSYFCHRFHLIAHLSPCFGEGRLSFLGGVKNESAFPYIGGSKLSRRKHRSEIWRVAGLNDMGHIALKSMCDP